jgi:hypothetical protein
MNGSGLTKFTMFDGAKMYAAAADAVNDQMPNSLHVLSHLLCTSIELALKSFLLHVGYSEKQLRKIGHDLSKLLKATVDEGFYYTGSRNFVLTVSGELYKQKIFAYPENANMNIILPSRLRQMTNEILNEVSQTIFTDQEREKLSLKGLSIESKYPDDINASEWYQMVT